MASFVRSTVGHAPRHASAVSELESFGDFAHLPREMSASDDSEFDVAKQAARFADFQFRVYGESDGLAFGSFASIAQPRFPDFPGESRRRVRQHLCTESIVRVSRPHVSRAATPSVSTARRFWAFLRRVRFTDFQLSRHPRSGVHREIERCSRNSFLASVLKPTSPNHALQRTAPGCHGSCFSRPGVSRSSRIATGLGASSAVHLRSYRASPPPSLSLGSFGLFAYRICAASGQTAAQ